MSRKHSFKMTLDNNLTEKEGVKYMMENHPGYFRIDLAGKKELLDKLGISHKFLQSFDLIYVPNLTHVASTEKIIETYLEDLIVVELKTTKKYLPENPKGFFFGATENEFNLGEILGEKFRFCFVCLNEKSPSISLKTIKELDELPQIKRIQYQINL